MDAAEQLSLLSSLRDDLKAVAVPMAQDIGLDARGFADLRPAGSEQRPGKTKEKTCYLVFGGKPASC